MEGKKSNRAVCLPVAVFRATTTAQAAQRLLEGFAVQRNRPALALLALQLSDAAEKGMMAYALTREGAAQPLLLSPCPVDASPMAQAQRLVRRVVASQVEEQAVWDDWAACFGAAATADSEAAQDRNRRLHVLCLPLKAVPEVQGAILLAQAGAWTPTIRGEMRALAEAASVLLGDVQRRQLFADLERSKQHWEATFDSLHDLLFIQDTAGRLLRVNQALAQRLGMTARELMARPERLAEHFAFLHCKSQSPHFTCTVPTLQATFDVTRTPAFDKRGNVIGWIHILRDITARLEMEGQMRQQEKLAALGQMLAGIAHELNNPLTSILGYSERLLNNAPETDAGVTECTRKIALQAERATHIVHDLLNFARTHAGDLQPVCLNHIVRETAELYAETLREADIRLDLRLCEPLPTVNGDPPALQQVFINMLSNARDAIREAGQGSVITLETSRGADGSVVLRVEDDGPGIRPEHLDRLVEPFFTTKRVGEGTGLGLSICFGILRAHNAALHVESPPGRGACFRMQFPPANANLSVSTEPNESVRIESVRIETVNVAAEERLVSAREQASEPEHKRQQEPVLQNKPEPLHIAVLDDEPILRDLLHDNLSEQGHRVCCFGTPEELLETLQGKRYDVILSDVKMPTMTGLELYEHVTRVSPAQAARIVYLSGDLMGVQTRAFMERTGCLYLMKPFRQAALLAKIAELTQQPYPPDLLMAA